MSDSDNKYIVPVTFSIAATIVLLYAFYKWATLNDDYFVKRKIKHLKPYFLVGNTGGFFLRRYRPDEFFNYLYNFYPTEKVVGLFSFRTPVMLLRDPSIVRRLTVTDFDHFIDRKRLIDANGDRLFGNSLFMMHGSQWRDMRSTLTPAFTGSKMRQMFELIGNCAVNMTTHIQAESMHHPSIGVEMKQLFAKCTNDVIATAAFGIAVNSFDNADNEFLAHGKRMLNFATVASAGRLLLIKTMPWVARAFGVQFIDTRATKFFSELVLDTMAVRRREHIYRPDMIDIMMHLKYDLVEDNSQSIAGAKAVRAASVRSWTDTELVAQCFLFFVAGFETTSTALAFAAYELATHPDVQQRLFQEAFAVHERLGGKPLPYDEIQKMTYLDMVVSEALRKWPPALFTNRECTKDYEYDDGVNRLLIGTGTAVWIPIHSFHYDEMYFPNAQNFDPERFSAERKTSIVAGTYIPFGLGPRNCIGSRFALMVMKVMIYNLVLSFTLEPNAKTQIPMKMMRTSPAIPIAENGVHLQLNLR